ncbi:hypothetical protein ACOSQ3_002819 [Xanthoceras sorbifolium]
MVEVEVDEVPLSVLQLMVHHYNKGIRKDRHAQDRVRWVALPAGLHFFFFARKQLVRPQVAFPPYVAHWFCLLFACGHRLRDPLSR